MDRVNVPQFSFDENVQGDSSRMVELKKHIVCNQLLLQNIVDNIDSFETMTCMKLACKRMNLFCSGPNKSETTLTIEQSDKNQGKQLEITHNNIKSIIEIENNMISKNDFQRIMACIPVDEIGSVHKIAIKGIKYLFKERKRDFSLQVKMSSFIYAFLDKFESLTELELTDLNIQEVSVGGKFISRIKILSLLDLSIERTQVWQLIGQNVEELNLTESMLRLERAERFEELAKQVPNTNIYLDNKEWRRHASYEVQDVYEENFYIYPWYRMLERDFNLNEQPIKSPKYCYYLQSIKLIKPRRDGNDADILEKIGQLEFLPKLKKVTIDGYFKKIHLEKLLNVLKKCRNITTLEMKRRHYTPNIPDWVNFIKKLPKNIICLKLNNCTTDQDIRALKFRKANTLRNLEIRVEENDLSMNSFKMIYKDFPKLRYLKLILIRLNDDNIQLLETCVIPKIEMFTKHHEKVSCIKNAMKKHYKYVQSSFDGHWNIEWNLLKNPTPILRNRLDQIRIEDPVENGP